MAELITTDFDDEEKVIRVDDMFETFFSKTQADSRYVNVTGDTMTGALYVPTPTLP